jgi:hypothetical protein
MSAVKAAPGDRIVIRSRILVKPVRDGEVVQVLGWGGGPPYLVRWSDEDRLVLIVPGRDAHVMRRARKPRPPGVPTDAVRRD